MHRCMSKLGRKATHGLHGGIRNLRLGSYTWSYQSVIATKRDDELTERKCFERNDDLVNPGVGTITLLSKNPSLRKEIVLMIYYEK